MRIAIMSDIHGFDLALERVLDDIAESGPYDQVIAAGDLVEIGPAPARTLELLERAGIAMVIGNTDRDIIEAALTGKSEPTIDFALARIGRRGVDLLAALPFSRRIAPPEAESAFDDLLVVHANPHDLDRKLRPEMSDQELRDLIGDVPAAAIAFGHHHVAFTRDLKPPLLVDVSAVGNPKDDDLRTRYGVLAWDGDARRWGAEFRYIPYPAEETAVEIRASGLPHPERTLQKLLTASY